MPSDAALLSPPLIPSSLFSLMQPETGPCPPAPFAWADTPTISSTVCQPPCGMVPLRGARRMAKVTLSIQWEASSAQIGRGQTVAPHPLTTPATSAQGAESHLTVLRLVLERKRLDPLPPYKPEAWLEYLLAAGLLDKYPSIPDSLHLGFDAGIPLISRPLPLLITHLLLSILSSLIPLFRLSFRKSTM